ncbi:chorismate synthase [Ezakiella peruensis]|uniref:chorismate synthase n=1 Tax=Ezakiella peruensis TaxID=1464038 RepID=UPI000C1B0D96|nr:chorismate synthase [Ezakiella peruensis]
MFTYGRDFRITIFGASHEDYVGILIDGIKAGTHIDFDQIKTSLGRRRPASDEETSRREGDELVLVSGYENDHTTEAPLAILIKNSDVKKTDYSDIKDAFRPGHADYSKFIKYQGQAYETGGGIFSGRMTVALVVAGEIARQIHDFDISSKIIFAEGNTGSHIKILAEKIDPGLGQPFFDSVESVVSHILFSVPSVKGINFGNILDTYKMSSVEVLDEFYMEDQKVKTKFNHDGGIQGGITNGMPLIINVFLKPIPTVNIDVETLDKDFNQTIIKASGRHDKQIANRVGVVLESAVQIALLDLLMRAR